MKRSSNSIVVRSCIAASFLLPLACTGPENDPLPDEASPRAAEASDLEELAREAIAAREGIDAGDLTLLGGSEVDYPNSGVHGDSFKFIAESTGAVFGATLVDGDDTDPQMLREEEVAATHALYGRFDPALHAAVAEATTDDPIEVAIWLTHDDDGRCDDLAPPSAAERERPGPMMGPLNDTEREPDHDGSDPDIGDDGEPVEPESNYDEVEDAEEEDDDTPDEEAEGTPTVADSPSPGSLSDDEAEAINASITACRREQVTDTVSPFVDRLRDEFADSDHGPIVTEPSEGGRLAHVQSLAPLVHVSLSPDELEQLSGWAEVETLYQDVVVAPELESSRVAVGANHLHNWNVEGAGRTVGVIEVGGRVTLNFPSNNDADMGLITENTINTCRSAHADAVVGVIHSQHATKRGIAPDSRVVLGGSCVGNIPELANAVNGALADNATALNLSWGLVPFANDPPRLAPNFVDRFYDNVVYNTAATVVKSAGNEGMANGQVTSPGLGYNVLTVGSYDDRNTHQWGDDQMAAHSSTGSPTSLHNDRTKPELVAPGQNIETLEFGDFGTISGTSIAAPHVTGATALMQQRDPWLRLFPEGVKAMFMTAASHNIEGAARLSNGDGAGALVVDNADSVFRNVTGDWGAQVQTCNQGGFRVVDTFRLEAGRVTRATVTWGIEGTYNRHALEPSADLDMGIWDPNGVRVASSGGWENNYEIVRFTPTQTGNYTMRVYDFRCDGINTRRVAWAWMQEYPQGVEYGVEMNGQGWGGWMNNGATAGTAIGGGRIERFRARGLATPIAMDVRYQVRQNNAGWSQVRENGQGAGVDGRKLQILKMWLFNQPTGWGIRYRLNRPTFGWTNWQHDGDAAGGTPLSLRKRGVQVELVPPHH